MTQPLVRIAQIESDELALRIRTVVQTDVILDDISDVNVTAVTEGQILEYGGSPIGWRAAPNSGGGLGDVILGSPITKGEFLVYQGSPSIWVNTDVIKLTNGRIVINGVSSTGSPSSNNNATLEISSSLPGILLQDTDGPSNEKNWRFIVSGGDLIGEMRSDSGTSSNRWLEVIRSGILNSEFSLFVGAEETAIRAVDGGAVELYHNNIDVAETTTAAAGGFRVNNQSTGAGFERVLTTSDLVTGGGGASVGVGDGLNSVTAGSPTIQTLSVDDTVARLNWGSPSPFGSPPSEGQQFFGNQTFYDTILFKKKPSVNGDLVLTQSDLGSPVTLGIQNVFTNVTGDTGSATADSVTTTLRFVGGAGISTSVAGSPHTITITNTFSGGSPTDQLHVVGGDGITVTYGSPDVSVAVDSTVLRTTSSLNDLGDVVAGSPTIGAVLYSDGTNWVKLPRGTNNQVLTMGSPLLPIWKTMVAGSPVDPAHIVGGDGITVTLGSPEYTIAVDSTVARSGDNVSIFVNDANYISSGSPLQYVQQGDNISLLTNDANYISSGSPLQYVQDGDNISRLVNDVGYLTSIGSPGSSANIVGGDGITVTTGSPQYSIAVDSTVLRTTSSLNDLGDVIAGSPTIGAVLYSDGTNWVKLPRGTNNQVLTMGSPLLPIWKTMVAGSPVDPAHIVGGDGITVTLGSPEYTIAVDGTVARSGDNVSIFVNDANYISSGSPLQYVQQGDNISLLTNDANYISSGSPLQYVQDGDNISRLVNDVGYLTSIGSPGSSANIVGGDGITVTTGSPQYSIAVDSTVLRTTSSLNDLGDVIAGSPTIGAVLYSDGTNWLKLPRGTNNQVLTMGSPLLPIWKTMVTGSPVDPAHIVGGDGITVTTGSPEYTIAVDSTVARSGDNISIFTNDANYISSGSPAQYVQDGDNISRLVNDVGYLTSIGSPGSSANIIGGDGITVTTGSPQYTIAVDSTVLRTTSSLNDIGDVNAGSPTIGAVLYNDGTNWLKLPRGTNGQVLTMGSPLLPSWKTMVTGSPVDPAHIVGGDGITVTLGSPEYLIAVDSSVARSGDNVSIFVNDANYISSGSPLQYVQEGDNISRLVNDAGYLTSIGSPLTNGSLNNLGDVIAGSPTLGAILYNDGTNWLKLSRGTNNQVLAMGSPLLPTWKTFTFGSPTDQLHVVGGDGITATYGSPEVSLAVDSTVLRTTSVLNDLFDVDTAGVTQNQVLTYAGSPLGWVPRTVSGGSGSGDSVFAGSGISIVAGSPLSNKTISVNSTVLRTTSNIDDLANVIGSPTVTGDIFYFDGTNWNTLSVGSAGQVLQLGSPLLPMWRTISAADITGSPVALPHIVGGTGISVTTGSPQFTIINTAPNVDQNIWLNVAADVGGPVAANTTTDTLTLAGGTRIRTTISGDTVTIDMTGSPVNATNVVGGDGITITYGSPEVSVAVDATVLRTTSSLNDLGDVVAGSPTVGAILYNDGTNWVKLPRGVSGQILTMGSPLLPRWTSGVLGSPLYGSPVTGLYIPLYTSTLGGVPKASGTEGVLEDSTLVMAAGTGSPKVLDGLVFTDARDIEIGEQASLLRLVGTYTGSNQARNVDAVQIDITNTLANFNGKFLDLTANVSGTQSIYKFVDYDITMDRPNGNPSIHKGVVTSTDTWTTSRELTHLNISTTLPTTTSNNYNQKMYNIYSNLDASGTEWNAGSPTNAFYPKWYGIYSTINAFNSDNIDAYALYLNNTTANSTHYGLYQNTSGVSNYFAGNLGLGVILPSTALDTDGTIRLRDGGQTDWVDFSHDGTDFNITGNNTTDINVIGVTSVVLPTSGFAATPTLTFGDGDTGFYEDSDDSIKVSTTGTARWTFDSSGNFGAHSLARAGIRNVAVTNTTPAFVPSQNDLDTGVGWNTNNELSLIAGGYEAMRLTTGSPSPTVTVFGDIVANVVGQALPIVSGTANQVLTVGSPTTQLVWKDQANASGTGDSVFAGDGISIVAGSPLTNKTISVNSTVLRTTSNIDDLANVIGSPTVTGDIFYFDGTNWNTLALGTAGQVLTVGSPLLPKWKTITTGSPTDQLHVVGGDGITVTYGSPEVSVAVDGTVFRTTNNLTDIADVIAGSPTVGSILYNDGTNWLKLSRGVVGQVLYLGSPLLPSWHTILASDITGSPVALPHIVAGTGISVVTGSPQFTIINTAPNVDQNLWLNIAADVGGPVAANTTTDTLTLAGGAGIRTTISGDTVTIAATGSPYLATNVVGGDGIIVVTGSPEVTVSVDSTVFRTTNVLNDIADVSAGSPTLGAILYNDGTNWLKLPKGTAGQFLRIGSPELPAWQTYTVTTGSPTDQLHVVGGDGITITYGSPEVTVAVDSTVLRTTSSLNDLGDVVAGSPTIGAILYNDGTNWLKLSRGTNNQVLTMGSPLLPVWKTFTFGSPTDQLHVVGGDGITITYGSPDVTVAVNATVFRTTDRLGNIFDVNITGGAGSPSLPTTGDTLYFDGTNWVNLGIGSAGQVLTVGSPSTFPAWVSLPVTATGLSNVTGGDGINVTVGSPITSRIVAVDSTVARLTGSPPTGSPSQIFQNPNTFLNNVTFEINPTTVDGTGVKRPVGLGVFPPYEIDTSAVFDTTHAGMVWHVDAGSPAVTFTAPNDPTIEIGSMWQVQNDDVENVTVAAGSPSVVILRLGAGGAPVSGNVLVQQGGIVSVYKYTDTEYWVYGDSEAIGFGSPIVADLKGLTDVNITGGAGSPSLPTIGDTLYYDGTNWVNLARGTNAQVLQMGSPLLPSWKTLSVNDLTGSPVALPHIVGGTGISVTTGSPQFTITNTAPNVDQSIWLNIAADSGGPVAANTTTDTLTLTGGDGITTSISGDTVTFDVDATIARISVGSPGLINIGSFIVDTVDLGTIGTFTTSTLTTTSTSQVSIGSFAVAKYRSAEFTVQATQGNNYHTTKLLAIHDGTNADSTEFGTITLPSFFGSPAAGSPAISGVQATYTVDISGGNLRLLATPVTTSSTVFKVTAHLTKV